MPDWDDDRPAAPRGSYRESRYERRDRDRYGDQRDDFDEDGFDDFDPRRAVRGPGLAMAIAGFIGILLSSVGFAAGLYLVVEERPRAGEDFVMGIFIAVSAVLGVAMFALIAMGGVRMQSCRNHGLAMAAAILLVCTIALLGLLAIPFVPFGVWALVVLQKREVKREFARVRGERY